MNLGTDSVPIGGRPRGDEFYNNGSVAQEAPILNVTTVPLLLEVSAVYQAQKRCVLQAKNTFAH